jgi:hypothetical protein
MRKRNDLCGDLSTKKSASPMEAKVGLEVEKNKKITALLIDPKSQ